MQLLTRQDAAPAIVCQVLNSHGQLLAQALRAVHGPARVANGTAAHIDLADVLEASSTPGSPSESSLHSSLSGSSDPDDILLADPGQQVGQLRTLPI